MNSIESSRSSYKIEFRSRNFDSKAETVDPSNQGIIERFSNTIWNQVKKWTAPKDQLCLTRVRDRGVEVIETPFVTKEEFEKFKNNEELSNEKLKSIKEFLNITLNIVSSEFSNEKLQIISNLILESVESSDKLDFIKTLVLLPNDKILTAFSEKSVLLSALDMDDLNKIIVKKNADEIINVLSKYPLWNLNRKLLKSAL